MDDARKVALVDELVMLLGCSEDEIDTQLVDAVEQVSLLRSTLAERLGLDLNQPQAVADKLSDLAVAAVMPRLSQEERISLGRQLSEGRALATLVLDGARPAQARTLAAAMLDPDRDMSEIDWTDGPGVDSWWVPSVARAMVSSLREAIKGDPTVQSVSWDMWNGTHTLVLHRGPAAEIDTEQRKRLVKLTRRFASMKDLLDRMVSIQLAQVMADTPERVRDAAQQLEDLCAGWAMLAVEIEGGDA